MTMDPINAIQNGDKRAAARLITMLENNDPAGEALLLRCEGIPSAARIVGITGAPGTGKSTLVEQLARRLAGEGKRVAIIAVDPSSPVTGGAFLGDRIRMAGLTALPEVFIRSMATRGALGGLSRAVPAAVRVMEIYGADYIFVETVGTGQSEVDIAGIADTVVLVLAPGMGDDIQAEKAGILEVADILAVNKKDHEGADRTLLQLREALDTGPSGMAGDGPEPSREIRIVATIATRGEGVDGLLEAIKAHRPR